MKCRFTEIKLDSQENFQIEDEFSCLGSPSLSIKSQSSSFNYVESSVSSFRETKLETDCSTNKTNKGLLMSGAQQSSVVQPLLTDFYQISMSYAYWKSEKHHEMATFDLYFRKNRKFFVFPSTNHHFFFH